MQFVTNSLFPSADVSFSLLTAVVKKSIMYMHAYQYTVHTLVTEQRYDMIKRRIRARSYPHDVQCAQYGFVTASARPDTKWYHIHLFLPHSIVE